VKHAAFLAEPGAACFTRFRHCNPSNIPFAFAGIDSLYKEKMTGYEYDTW
jgi:hypothetical protein